MGNDPTPEPFQRYLRAIVRLEVAARPWLAGRLDPAGLVEQVLARGHGPPALFRGRESEARAAWLRQALIHTLATELRTLGLEQEDTTATPNLEAVLNASVGRLDAWLGEPAGAACERAERLAEAVEALPVEQRRVVLLAHGRGMTLREIARRVGGTTTAIAGLLRQGLAHLREHLEAREAP